VDWDDCFGLRNLAKTTEKREMNGKRATKKKKKKQREERNSRACEECIAQKKSMQGIMIKRDKKTRGIISGPSDSRQGSRNEKFQPKVPETQGPEYDFTEIREGWARTQGLRNSSGDCLIRRNGSKRY